MNHIATGVSIKAVIAASGLAGGITIAGVYIPKKIVEKGILIGGAIVGGTSVFSSLAFTEFILEKFGFDATYTMPVAFVIGAGSLFAFNAIGNWARKHEDDTVFEVIKEIHDNEKSEK